MSRNLFAGIEQSDVETSAGVCQLPLLYTDASVLGLVYRVEVKRAAVSLGEDTPFEVFPLMGKALVQLAVFEYRDSTIGPYNELALALTVRRKGTRPSSLRALVDPRGNEDQGLYFLTLPVTTANANAAGRELWGYPKYVAGIDTDFRETGVRAELEGEIEMSIGQSGSLVTPGIPFVLMSTKDDRVLRTTVEVDHRLTWGGAPSAELRVLGEGPTADHVCRLGLDSTKPSFAWRTLNMRSVLPLGKDIGLA